jgi:hypothetical protein
MGSGGEREAYPTAVTLGSDSYSGSGIQYSHWGCNELKCHYSHSLLVLSPS